MTSAPKKRLQALSEHLVNRPRSVGNSFEDLPNIPMVAGDSTGPRVKDKVIIITGCNSPLGIGRASAHHFANNGAKAIYICDLATDHLDKHKREIESKYPGVDVQPRKMDAGEESDVEKVVNEVLEKYGRLDVFFANAGISVTMGSVLEASSEDFMRTMKINSLSVFLAVKHGARGMLKTSDVKPYPGGSIVGVASSAGMRSNAGATDYSASKAAVISIMQTTAFQLAGTGIRCNAICPGIIETGMTAPMYEMARARGSENKIGQLNPLMRGGVADEVARVALFLGSDESSYVNGQAWAVCGGLTAGHPFVPGKIA
ncbi:related to levodione reductase [Ramularia collo-cygni]|uniref:Related to levodione reductase n=1 Tax=Ramularia collo-cygni TaxID=112498 RepID=A0A2D3VMU3_9PEZI|nr:related to levodione reductase [Ramularia collo-cygni]CZT25209.1 related to levodione reductase [Ramularia collo-cygni]